MRHTFFTCLFLLLGVAINTVPQVFGQQLIVKKDSTTSIVVKVDSVVAARHQAGKKRDPRRASLLSAVLPGAGQVYNRKYWKLPLLAGGAYALGYYINLNHEQYVLTRDAYMQRSAGEQDRFNNTYTPEQLVRLREYWRRNRDLLIIITGFVYLLNIADAAVDAHLSGFDVSDDLSLRLQPQIWMAGGQPAYGLGMVVNLQ